jgi:hypothetical protein
MTTDTAHTRWHPLPQLAELPGPEWRLPCQQRGELRLVRAFEHYVETICVDGDVVAVSRLPIAGRSARTIATANFAGSVDEAMEFLRRPPRWESQVQHPEVQRDVRWP